MKTLTLVAAVMLALPSDFALAEEAKTEEAKVNAVETCKAKANFTYNFEMMTIEREEIEKTISHDDAREKKRKRHEEHREVLEDCDDLKDD